MGDMAAMAITSERDLPKLTAIMEDILEDTDMAGMVTTLERDLPMLTAIMEDILEDTVMAAMVTILERDLPKLMPILSSSDTTHTEMDMLSQLMPWDTSGLERDLLKLKASHTTDTEVCMVDMVTVDTLTENRFQKENRRTDFVQFYDLVISHIKFQPKSRKIKIYKKSMFGRSE